MSKEQESYLPTIEQPEIKEERLKIPNYALLGIFTSSLERARVGDEPTEEDYKAVMISDDEPNLVDGVSIRDSQDILLHLDVPPREYEDPKKFLTEFSRSVDMAIGYSQAIPDIRYIYGTSYLSRYSTRYGFTTEDLPPDSLKAKVSMEMYRDARGADKEDELPNPKLAYATPESLLEKTETPRSIEDNPSRTLGALRVEHQRLLKKEKALSSATQEEMKNFCVGNTLKIEVTGDDEKEVRKSMDMLAGYIQAFPFIWNIYVTNTGGFSSVLEEVGFRDLNSDDCPIFSGREQMIEQGGQMGATIIELKEWAVQSSDKIKPIDQRKMVA
jgi:hypothetical protein